MITLTRRTLLLICLLGSLLGSLFLLMIAEGQTDGVFSIHLTSALLLIVVFCLSSVGAWVITLFLCAAILKKNQESDRKHQTNKPLDVT